MLWVFGVGYFTSIAIGLMVLMRLAARASPATSASASWRSSPATFELDEAVHIKRGLE